MSGKFYRPESSDKLRTMRKAYQSPDCISQSPEYGGTGAAEVPWGLQGWGRCTLSKQRPAGTPVAFTSLTDMFAGQTRRFFNTHGCWVAVVAVKAFVLFIIFPGPPFVTEHLTNPSLLFGVNEFSYFSLGRINPKIPAIV